MSAEFKALGSYAGPEIADSGLLLHLDATNVKSYPGSGSTWYDLSGNSNNFTMNGSLAYSVTGGFSGFTSVNRWYRNSTSWPSNLKTSQGGSGYTTLIWCKLNGSSGWQKIIGNGDEQGYIDLYIRDATTRYYQEDGSSLFYNSNIATAQDTLTLTAGTWYLLGSTNSNSGTLTNPTDQFGIGAEGDAAYNYPFNGNIAVVTIYNRVLSSAEIINYYNATRDRFTTPAEVKAGLILDLDAGNTSSYSGSGSTWTDLSGSGYNATISGSPTFTSSGSGSYFTINNGVTNQSMQSSVPKPNLPVTLSFWVYPLNTNLALFDTAPNTQNVFRLYSGSVEWWNADPAVAVSPSIPANSWYNLVFVYDYTGNRKVWFYLNGRLIGSGTGSTTSTYAWSTFVIGNVNATSGGVFSGRIAKAAIYNRALSDVEIGRNFDALRGRYGL